MNRFIKRCHLLAALVFISILPATGNAAIRSIEPAVSNAVPNSLWHWRNPLPQGNSLSRVIYGNNKFVAVGSHGTIMTSSDGTVWNQTNSGTTNDLVGIAYGNNTFIAIDRDGCLISPMD